MVQKELENCRFTEIIFVAKADQRFGPRRSGLHRTSSGGLLANGSCLSSEVSGENRLRFGEGSLLGGEKSKKGILGNSIRPSKSSFFSGTIPQAINSSNTPTTVFSRVKDHRGSSKPRTFAKLGRSLVAAQITSYVCWNEECA